MSISPIGGMKPVATRLILEVHTDADVVGLGEGTGGGAELFRQGLADLVIELAREPAGEICRRAGCSKWARPVR